MGKIIGKIFAEEKPAKKPKEKSANAPASENGAGDKGEDNKGDVQ